MLAVLVAGCESPQSLSTSFKGQTMGTTYHITISSDLAEIDQGGLHKSIDALLVAVNQSFSTYIASSEVSQLNKHTQQQAQIRSQEFIELLSEALHISELTQGAYDITVAPLVNLWGFGPDFKEDDVPKSEQINQALNNVGYEKILVDSRQGSIKKLNPSVYLDFSSIAKGYGVDKVAELLETNNHLNYMVEIGGEIRVRGLNPQGDKWRIAVENPDSAGKSIYKVLNVSDIAIATSGDYRNFFEKDGIKFSHTINPTTGQPVQHNLASVTVLSQSSATADAWATAFMVLGGKKGYDLAKENNLAALFLLKEGEATKALVTPAFKAVIEEHKR